MTLDPAPASLADLVFSDGGQEASCGPAFFIGALGKLDQIFLDGR